MVKNVVASIIKLPVTQPLSLLRFFLSLLVGLYTYNSCLSYFFTFKNIKQYELNATWIIELFPERLFAFLPQDLVYWKAILVLAIIGSAIGFLGRISLLLLGTITFIFYGFDEGLGSFDHQVSFSSQVIFILALIPGSMGVSIDQYFINKWFKKDRFYSEARTYKWGVTLLLLLLILTYFTAGISKLRYGGTNYLDGNTIGFYIQDHTFEYPQGKHKLIIGDPSLPKTSKWKDDYGLQAYTYSNIQKSLTVRKVQYWIVEQPWLLKGITIFTIIFELGGFIVFFGSKYRNWYLFFAFLFHTTIGFLMGFTFYQYRLIILCLMDWKAIYAYVAHLKWVQPFLNKLNIKSI
ncbi:hypothetical protein [Cellulophaga tyrosinoxydans]|uniref:HTTM domain-containing protein n=1 Tax=Cellulophaga tyrosinoxydans TaxID=504486 RepID=A0A1W2A2K4_9FLAO|nr:hypothetical protein [Cellulophaga tyrosinoxydans]SMC54959.1 hypothetical protein SAMN05660703_1754 [Cellulophaga tyrosinoxydans]